jgi:hypothetical protein
MPGEKEPAVHRVLNALLNSLAPGEAESSDKPRDELGLEGLSRFPFLP